jgi:predicted permease
MDAELQFHLDTQIRDYVAQGLSREDAELRARREFGSIGLAKEECRDQKPFEPFDRLFREIRYASRSLRKSPGFMATVILTLALGIGANTATFSVLHSVLLAPLPYREPDRLVMMAVYNRTLKYAMDLSYPDFIDWQRSARSFEQIAAFATHSFDLTNLGAPEHLEGMEVASGFFSTLGVKQALGRSFTPQEDRYGGAPAVIISHRLWQNRFGGNEAAIGTTVTLSGVDYTLVGVLPQGFRWDMGEADVYTPLGREGPLLLNDRTIHIVLCVGRLRAGVTPGQALAEMNTIQEHIDELNPTTEKGLGGYVVPLRQSLVGDLGGTLLLLLGAVGLVLLIACANVANLLLARSTVRAREFSVRLALGASRAQIVRQLMAESVLLSLAGAIPGLAIAYWVPKAVLAAVPGSLPLTGNIGVNASVLLFAFAVSLAVGIVFGLVPAWKSSKTSLQIALRQGGRGLVGSYHRTQRFLVVVQIALALVLLAGGSLLLRTIHNLWAVNPGFQTHGITAFQVGLSPSAIRTPASTRIAYQQMMQRIREVPGVQAADFTALVPLSQDDNSGPFWVGPRPPASISEIPRALYYWVGPDYLETMRIPLLRGRFLDRGDNLESEPVIVIDSLLSDRYFPDRDPIGKMITIPHWGVARIVGVTGHVKSYALDSSTPEYDKPEIYCDFYQLSDRWVPLFRSEISVVVRTPIDPSSVMPAIRKVVYGSGSDQPVYNVRTMDSLVSGSMAPQRLPMILLVAFAILALLLATVGIYGVISYSMAQRVQEVGIGMALGAAKGDVLRMLVGQGLRLTLAGVAIGAVAALALTRTLTSFSHLLYGVGANDPVTFVAVSMLLLGAALAACYIPARRAARLDPMTALRNE